MEAIILAGGLGTRLRSVVSDKPKVLSSVAGKPFLSYLIDFFSEQGINHFIFSIGFLGEQIEEFLNHYYINLNYSISKEESPLGTGGAIKQSLNYCKEENILIANGDTFFKVDIPTLFAQHISRDAECTLALKQMHNFDRYGTVELNDDGVSIKSFEEKSFRAVGLINGGVCMLKKQSFFQQEQPEVFSFEKDFLEPNIARLKMEGFISEEYFIDIGVPLDYQKAQMDFQNQ